MKPLYYASEKLNRFPTREKNLSSVVGDELQERSSCYNHKFSCSSSLLIVTRQPAPL